MVCLRFKVEGDKTPFIMSRTDYMTGQVYFTNKTYNYNSENCPIPGDTITASLIQIPGYTQKLKVERWVWGGAQKTPRVKKEIQSSPSSTHFKEINNFLLNAANKFTEFNILFKCPVNKKISARRKNENAGITNLYERHFAHFQ